MDKLKNGSPATKILALFLVAPKGFFIFSPILIKRFLAKTGIEINAGAIAGFSAKIALGLAIWATLKKFIRENHYLKKSLKDLVNMGQLIE